MKKILLYAALYPGKGIGHIVRTAALMKYLQANSDWNVKMMVNQVEKSNELLNKLQIEVDLLPTEKTECDLILLDSPKEEESLLNQIQFKKLVRLDYFDYQNEKVDLIINLFNHIRNGQVDQFKGRSLEGLKYTILRDEILKAKQAVNFNIDQLNVLVTFGGEDPNNNTLQAIEAFQKHDNIKLTVICPPLQSMEHYKKVQSPIEWVNFTSQIGRYYGKADIIVCGGGTTLLEAIYFGRPVIAIAQNEMEEDFIQMIGNKLRLYQFSDTSQLVGNYSQELSQTQKEYLNFVDGLGKKRIFQELKGML